MVPTHLFSNMMGMNVCPVSPLTIFTLKKRVPRLCSDNNRKYNIAYDSRRYYGFPTVKGFF